ncbi:MAG: pre-peptidase C-terminal domain-containing protein [Chloroflexota bacterium]|nr:pre-peptidase C-terminal domain-containing protein [Chloroflexota bacterium]
MPRRPSGTHSFSRLVTLGVITALISLLLIHSANANQVVPFIHTSSPNGLVINEIYDSQTPGNEYFELYNTSSVVISLVSYSICNHESCKSLAGIANPTIGAGELKAIGASQLPGGQIGMTGLDRNDFLGLTTSSPSDQVIDVVNFGGPPNPNWPEYANFSRYFFQANTPNLPAADGDKSLQRYPDGQDSDQGSDFAAEAKSPDSTACSDPYEGDNDPSTATTQAVNTTVLHRLCPSGDQDWISLSLSASFTYTLQTTPVGTQVDTILRLYDAGNSQIVEDNNPGSRGSIINFRPTSSGIFRVQIVDANNGGAPGAPFLYTFSVASTSVPTSTPTNTPGTGSTATPTVIACSDPYEPDNTVDTARPIQLNTEQIHTLCPVGDVDWVTFSASAGKIYTLFTKDLAGSVDTVITLYDSTGHRLAENDDYQPGQGLYSRIDYSFTSTDVYYLRIRDKSGGGGFGYQYTVGFSSTGALPSTSTPSATPTTNPNSPTPTAAPCNDSYEPDGIPDAAKLILIGTTQHHSICPASDADWVKFYARAGKVYTIRTSNLGVGLDTYMYLFDSDGRTILAQNDDGGDGVASRIDFYPRRDDFYYAQVKNAGDLGGPDQTYDLSLAVVPGAPQPPGTATNIIAPAFTGTPAEQPPTVVVQPTKGAQNTPTQGAQPPTPAAAGITGTPVVPVPVQSKQVPIATKPAATGVPVIPAATAPAAPSPAIPPTADVSIPSPTAQVIIVPNPPKTGAVASSEQPAKKVGTENAPVVVIQLPPKQDSVSVATAQFRLFYDAGNNSRYRASEGIRGLLVYFMNSDGLTASGKIVTGDAGEGTLQLPLGRHKVFIPYFDIKLDLVDFPDRELHQFWLPAVKLSNRVP